MAEQVLPTTLGPRKRGRMRLTPRDYADMVNAHSLTTISESLYPGHLYVDLASLLLQPYQSYAPRIDSPHQETSTKTQHIEVFGALLDIRENAKPQFRYLKNPADLPSGGDDQDQTDGQAQSSYGALLFLRGYALPDWLNAVGARYLVDPEYFLRHLNTFFQSSHSNYFTTPELFSGPTSMVRLCITTIGRRMGHHRHGKSLSQRDLQSMRHRAEQSLRRHIEGIARSSDSDLRLGDSMVRHFSVHDEEHFSLEQYISIYITKSGDGWIGVIWSDVGNDLAQSLVGPWQDEDFDPDSWDINYLPTLQYAPRIAFKSRKGPRNLSEPPEQAPPVPATPKRKIPQSASLLHLGYSKKTNSSIMASDPFYALNDVFSFVASSELQIINLIEEKLRNEVNYAALDQHRYQDVSNILYHKSILKRHIAYLQQIIAFTETRGDTNWRRTTDAEMCAKTEAAAHRLLKSFQNLYDRARTLVAECDSGMAIRINNLQIKEAQSALKQAKATVKLTKLAFFYVPLSFTTSLFGMNVIDFGIDATVWVWQWAVLAALLLTVSFAFMVLDWRSTWRSVHSVRLPTSWLRRVHDTNKSSRTAQDTPLASL